MVVKELGRHQCLHEDNDAYVAATMKKGFIETRCQTVSDSSCETQESRCDFRTLFVTPTDSICKVKTNISTKDAEKKAEKLL